MPPAVLETEYGPEYLRVVMWRFDEARSAGLTKVEAMRYAESDADSGLFRRLVRSGCDSRLIYEIVV